MLNKEMTDILCIPHFFIVCKLLQTGVTT